MSPFEYVRDYYKVPAEYGRIVTVSGRTGIIIEDRGHYIGVNFDSDKPGQVSVCHPTSEVVYGGIGKPRKPSKSAARYQRYLSVSECFDNFVQFLYYETDQRNAEKCGFSDVRSYRQWLSTL